MLRRFPAIVGILLLLSACTRVGQSDAVTPVRETCELRKPDLHAKHLFDRESEWKLPDVPAIVVGPERIQALYGARHERERGRFSIHEFRVGKIDFVAAAACPIGLLPARLGLAYSGSTTVICNSPDAADTSIRSTPVRIAYGELQHNGSFAWTTLDDANGDNDVVGFVALPDQVAILYDVHHSVPKVTESSFRLSLLPSRTSVELRTQRDHPGYDKVLAMFQSKGTIHVIVRAAEPSGWRDYWDLSYSPLDGNVTALLLEQSVAGGVPGKLDQSCISSGALRAPLSIAFPFIRYVDAFWTDRRIGQVQFTPEGYVDGLDVTYADRALCPPAGSRNGWWRASVGTDGWVAAYQSEGPCKNGPPVMKIMWSSLQRSSEREQIPE
jgi:hypothetical protein